LLQKTWELAITGRASREAITMALLLLQLSRILHCFCNVDHAWIWLLCVVAQASMVDWSRTWFAVLGWWNFWGGCCKLVLPWMCLGPNLQICSLQTKWHRQCYVQIVSIDCASSSLWILYCFLCNVMWAFNVSQLPNYWHWFTFRKIPISSYVGYFYHVFVWCSHKQFHINCCLCSPLPSSTIRFTNGAVKQSYFIRLVV
jgi:hypothetical protein